MELFLDIFRAGLVVVVIADLVALNALALACGMKYLREK